MTTALTTRETTTEIAAELASRAMGALDLRTGYYPLLTRVSINDLRAGILELTGGVIDEAACREAAETPWHMSETDQADILGYVQEDAPKFGDIR